MGKRPSGVDKAILEITQKIAALQIALDELKRQRPAPDKPRAVPKPKAAS